MKQQTVAPDNITEILVKIIEFTKKRQKILIRNINNIQNKTFIPKDLDADEFSDILSAALYDHQRTGWLILRDGRYTKFGANGTFQTNPLTDTNAKLLLKESYRVIGTSRDDRLSIKHDVKRVSMSLFQRSNPRVRSLGCS